MDRQQKLRRRFAKLVSNVVDLHVPKLLSWTIKQTFKGTGIVLCGGGKTYSPLTYLLCQQLDSMGIHLPIEIWSANEEEQEYLRLLPWKALSVSPMFCNTQKVLTSICGQTFSDLFFEGWQIKPCAVFASQFCRVILLDVDMLLSKKFKTLILKTFMEKSLAQKSLIVFPDITTYKKDEYLFPHWMWTDFNMKVPSTNQQDSSCLVVNKTNFDACMALSLFTGLMLQDYVFCFSVGYGDKDFWNWSFQFIHNVVTPLNTSPQNYTKTNPNVQFVDSRIGTVIAISARKDSVPKSIQPLTPELTDSAHTNWMVHFDGNSDNILYIQHVRALSIQSAQRHSSNLFLATKAKWNWKPYPHLVCDMMGGSRFFPLDYSNTHLFQTLSYANFLLNVVWKQLITKNKQSQREE